MEADYSQASSWAQAQLASGAHPEALVSSLMGQGWSELQAREVLVAALSSTPRATATRPGAPVMQYASPAQRPGRTSFSSSGSSRHTTNMFLGGAICVVGIGITAATYASATTSGGTYMVCWGAMLFGAIRFLRGLAGWMGGS